MLLPVEDERLLFLEASFCLRSSSFSAAFLAAASVASFSAASRCFTIFSNADSRSTTVSYFPLMREEALMALRCSTVMAPIWLNGKSILAFWTMEGAPFRQGKKLKLLLFPIPESHALFRKPDLDGKFVQLILLQPGLLA